MKSKTSIYVDEEIWKRFKAASSKRGTDMSEILEGLILDDLEGDDLSSVPTGGTEPGVELEFKPIKLRGRPVSGLVRVQRDEREDNLSR